MQTLLLKVDYTDGTGLNGKGSFWADSWIKNTEITQQEGETIHDTVKRAIEDIDYNQLCYNGKPRSNVYRDCKAGTTEIVGYIYRVKMDIEDRSNNFSGQALFDAWVEIKAVNNLRLKDIEE